MLALSVALPASADEGRIPLWDAGILFAPGEYVLTRDIVTDGQITIRADGVVLDLNGHTLETTTLASAIVVNTSAIGGPLERGVTIRNGRIKGGGFAGIRVHAPAGGRVRIENVEIVGSSQYGIHLRDLDEFTVRNCRIRSVGYQAISYQLADTTGLGRGVVAGNLVVDAGDAGISVSGVSGAQVHANVVLGAGGMGIAVAGDGNRISDNAIHDAGRTITASALVVRGLANRVESNIASGSSEMGIDVLPDSPRTVLRKNVVTGNANHGISVSGNHGFVEDNLATANGGYGLYADMMAGLVVYRGNMLLNNGTDSAGGLSPGRLDDQGGNLCTTTCP
jgi:hypothetical protein